MESINNKPILNTVEHAVVEKTGGEKKIDEYVKRIQEGESRVSIEEGLPESFKSGIEKRLAKSVAEEVESGVDEIPPQYTGLSSEILDFIWTIPEYLDQEKTKVLKEKKARVLAFLRERELAEELKVERHQADQEKIKELRNQLGITEEPKNTDVTISKENPASPEEIPLLGRVERKKLRGWAASYELAKIAKQQGIDLSKISREEYVDFAIQNYLAIDDAQLRAAPWQRMGTSVQEIVLKNRERKAEIREESDKAFVKFCYDIQQKAGQEDRSISENIRVRQGTKDSNSWLFFGINNSLGEISTETYKSYISVKDLNTLTPERFTQFMSELRDAKYNGDIKIFQDLSEQGVKLNDQIVMHGGSQADAELALQVAEKFFGADLDQKSVGKDEVIDGKNQSYSQVLAQRISEAINPKSK